MLFVFIAVRIARMPPAEFVMATLGPIRSKSFAGFYHEIFNERHPEPVLETLDAWLEERYPLI